MQVLEVWQHESWAGKEKCDCVKHAVNSINYQAYKSDIETHYFPEEIPVFFKDPF
jgi:hypothetical protein